MAILDFFNKDKADHTPTPDLTDYAPKSDVGRGQKGRFVSKKKIQAQPEPGRLPTDNINAEDVIGPIMAPFDGGEVRKFYTNKKWYFSAEDLSLLVHTDPAIKQYNQLKEEPKFKPLYNKYLKSINNIDCLDFEGADTILRETIRTYKATFSGSLFRWLEDISTHEPEKTTEQI